MELWSGGINRLSVWKLAMYVPYLSSVSHSIKREKVILSNLISVTEVFQASLWCVCACVCVCECV